MYILFLFMITLNVIKAKYGQPCNPKDYIPSVSNNMVEFCNPETRTCKCYSNSTLYYDMNARPYCYITFKDAKSIDKHSNKDCLKHKCSRHQYCNSKGHCQCKKPFITVCQHERISCHKYVLRSPLDFCFVKGSAYICNSKQFSYCEHAQCVCYDGYFLNVSTATCVPRTGDLFGYKSRPGEYCSNDDDCVEGLECDFKNRCLCPFDCSYKKELGTCDCGHVSLRTPLSVVVSGVLIGCASLIVWAWHIVYLRQCVHKYVLSADHRSISRAEVTPLTSLTAELPPPSYNDCFIFPAEAPPAYEDLAFLQASPPPYSMRSVMEQT